MKHNTRGVGGVDNRRSFFPRVLGHKSKEEDHFRNSESQNSLFFYEACARANFLIDINSHVYLIFVILLSTVSQHLSYLPFLILACLFWAEAAKKTAHSTTVQEGTVTVADLSCAFCTNICIKKPTTDQNYYYRKCSNYPVAVKTPKPFVLFS